MTRAMPRPRSLLALVLVVTTLAHEQAEAACDGCVDLVDLQQWSAGLDPALEGFPVAVPPAPAPVDRPGGESERPRQVGFATGLDRLMGAAAGRSNPTTQAAAR